MSEKDDIVIQTLKRRYFETISRENIGVTHGLTKVADHLEEAIKKLQRQKKETKE